MHYLDGLLPVEMGYAGACPPDKEAEDCLRYERLWSAW